jgi:hypothetical protein
VVPWRCHVHHATYGRHAVGCWLLCWCAFFLCSFY